MWRETNLFGVLLPPLVIYMIVALALYLLLHWVLSRFRLFRWVANPPLAGIAIYICILALLVGWL